MRTRVRVLFSLMSALLLLAVLLRFNFQNEQMMQWLQVGLILLMMVLGLWEIHRINRGLRKLARVSDSIGQGNYSVRADSNSRDAVGLLGKAINSMAERVQSSIGESEESRTELVKSKEALDRQNEQLSSAFARQTKFGEFLADLTSIDINTLANKSLEHILAAAQAQLGAFYLYDDTSRRLVCLTAQGVDRTAVKQISQENSLDGLPGAVFTQQKWIFVEAASSNSALEIDLGLAQVKLRCVYGIPVLFRNQVLGVILLASLSKPEKPQVEYLRNHVDALANGLNNALGYKAINRQSILLEKVNEELRKADQLRSEFVANMSHELRTPLNSIIGFSGIMLKNRSKTLDEGDLKRAEKIHRNGKNLLYLINDILDLSKIEAGRMDLSSTPTRLFPLLHEIKDLLQPQADTKNIHLALELPDAEQTIETDDQKLRQVLINLVGNAIKFTAQGVVTIRLEPTDEVKCGAIIHVKDTGIGIAQDKLETIFEAFRQADNSTTREYGGTGLGLTISRSLVEMLGGNLTVISEMGKGSTFTIRLPGQPSVSAPGSVQRNVATHPLLNGHSHPVVAERQHPFIPERKSSIPSLIEEYRTVLSRSLPIKAGQRVLIVDDDPDARELISHFVQDLGAKAIPCSHSPSALRVASEEKPDLITLDLSMPEKSGWDVLSSLKSDPFLRDIPVIIISIVADRRRAVSLGAVDALTKPIIRSEFNASVERVLQPGATGLGKVLIVEDEPDARNLMCAWLESQVGEMRTANNGQEALGVLESFRPDLIFLDLQMPIMDGPTFLEHLRKDERFATLPVIVITAKTLELPERKNLEAKVSKILLKGEVFSE